MLVSNVCFIVCVFCVCIASNTLNLLAIDEHARVSLTSTLLNGCRDSYAALLSLEKKALAEKEASLIGVLITQPDDLINFR
jgi:hypothetical protein